jgi:quercetin dioxygenase-like cupin family protein
MKQFLHENEVAWEDLGGNVERQILGYNDQIMMVKVKFNAAGATGSAHTHPHTQVTYVASGKFEFDINGEKQVVVAGDGMYMDPSLVHGCVCLEPGVLIDVFTPCREDFLKK